MIFLEQEKSKTSVYSLYVWVYVHMYISVYIISGGSEFFSCTFAFEYIIFKTKR